MNRFATLSFVVCLFLLASLGLTLHVLQEKTAFQQHAATLDNSMYGIAAGSVMNGLSSSQINTYMDGVKALGASWIRFDFSWALVQPNNASAYNWEQYDTVVAAANARGLKVLGIIDEPPAWAVSSSCASQNSLSCPPTNPATFATFAAAVAAHYAPKGVHTWEIWNEENISVFWAKPDPIGYTALLKAAYPAIKKADSTAFVLTGGTAPAATDGTNYSPTDFLSAIYKNGGKGYFDAVAAHPYCYSDTPCPTVGAWSQLQATSPSLRSIMTANGDQNKQIWGTEFGTPTKGGSGVPTEAQQAQMVTTAYNLWSTYSWHGPLFWYTYQDGCTDTTDIECFFGLVRIDNSQKPAYAAYKALATSTTSPLTPTQKATITATPTIKPTPTIAMKPTSAPTVVPTSITTLSPTAIPSQTQTSIDITIFEHGIGQSGDSINPTSFSLSTQNPAHPQINTEVQIFALNNQLIASGSAVLNFDSSVGAFTATAVPISTGFPTGTYWLEFRTNYHLSASTSATQTITAGQENVTAPVTLIAGDLNNDNTLSILDYNILIGCYSDFIAATSCTPEQQAATDLNDDGSVNEDDYNLFLRELAAQQGLP